MFFFSPWRPRLSWLLLFLASLAFCLVFDIGTLRQTAPSVAAQSPLPHSELHSEVLERNNQGSGKTGKGEEKIVSTNVTWNLATTQQLSSSLVEQGLEAYREGKFPEAIAIWQQALPQLATPENRAVVHSNLALAYQQIGQIPAAIAQWEEAMKIYRGQNTPAGTQMLARLLTEQAQAYSDLGQHQRAIPLLQTALDIARQLPDRLGEAAAEGALGNAYWGASDYKQALSAHENSLKIARELNNSRLLATSLNNRGNVYVSQAIRSGNQSQSAELEGNDQEAARLNQAAAQDRVEARKSFEESLQVAQGLGWPEEFRPLINLNHLIEMESSLAPAQPLSPNLTSNWNRARELLAAAPDSREKAYALIRLAEDWKHQPGTLPQQSVSILEQALTVSQMIADAKAESFALGSLGQLYEAAGDYDKAMEFTRKALFRAQQINAPDSLYRWQWQAGRIFKATGDKEKAITAYQQAIVTLQSIRGDLVAANQELQLDFREQVEPVYRELIGLWLESPRAEVKQTKQVGKPAIAQTVSASDLSSLKSVVETLELLKLAELQNFFGDECVQVAQSKAKDDGKGTNPQTALVYSIVLNDHSEMILQLPNGSMTHYPVAMSQKELEAEIDQLRFLLELRATNQYLPQAQKIYNLLIRPLEADLGAVPFNTLVFINDGVLRKVPMAALHDGQKFLVEKYPIANTPSLSLTNRQALKPRNWDALSVGLTVARTPFAALTNVNAEIKAVQEILGGNELIDETFTISNLQAQLQQRSYPIIHMATHGKFGVDAQSTFLLGFDRQLSIEELDNLLRIRGKEQPVALLTLSACQTAVGDNRSALGMAGVAVRAGVESALATLWYINDQATVPLIEEFYRQLRQPEVTKAEALRQAQLKMIADVNYNHPAVWSPFILIGNWL